MRGKFSIYFLMLVIAINLVYAGSVSRTLSSNIVNPENNLQVSIVVNVDQGENFYAIEEFVPTGWTIINPGGGRNDVAGRITWVEFTNPVRITYTYTIKSPVTAGVYLFNGDYTLGSSVVNTITGDNSVQVKSVSCGDNVIDTGEECDDGNSVNSDDCTNSCKNAVCGDSIVWNLGTGTEVCDSDSISCTQGGYSGTKACLSDCSGYGTCQLTELCGDGIIQTGAGEVCDDNNIINGDGCSSICREEPGHTCTGQPSVCVPCIITNAVWSTTSAVEREIVSLNVQGSNCNGETVNFAVWENDVLDTDDPVLLNPSLAVFASNSATSSWTAEWQCDGDLGGVCTAGNPEYYFIANTVTGSFSTESLPMLTTTASSATCGNSIKEIGEECDNGASNSNTNPDACRLDCKLPKCGDSVEDTGEQCDLNNFGIYGNGIGQCSVFDPRFSGGNLICTASCTIDTSSCIFCNTAADVDCNGCVVIGELLAYIEIFHSTTTVTIEDLSTAIITYQINPTCV